MKIKTVENLFQLKGSYDSPNADFILEEPAIVSLLPDNRQWKLIQPGVLFFWQQFKIQISSNKTANSDRQ